MSKHGYLSWLESSNNISACSLLIYRKLNSEVHLDCSHTYLEGNSDGERVGKLCCVNCFCSQTVQDPDLNQRRWFRLFFPGETLEQFDGLRV